MGADNTKIFERINYKPLRRWFLCFFALLMGHKEKDGSLEIILHYDEFGENHLDQFQPVARLWMFTTTRTYSAFLLLFVVLKFIVPIYHSLSQMQFSRHLQELDHIRRRCLNAEFIHHFVKLVKLPNISCALAHIQIHPIVSTNLKQDFNQPCCEIRFSLLVLKARTASQALKDKWSSDGTPFKYNSLGFFIFGSLFLATFPRKLTKKVPLLNRYNILNSVTFVALHIKIIGIPDACITCRLSE